MLTLLIRLIWISCHAVALFAIAAVGIKRFWWLAYIVASLVLALFYWPESPKWAQLALWPMLAVLMLRCGAALEAVHFIAPKNLYWPRMTLGVWLLAASIVAAIWWHEPGTTQQQFVHVRRYLQIWLALAMILECVMIAVTNFWKWNRDSFSALAIGLMVLNHGVVSAMAMGGYFVKMRHWIPSNNVSMAIDAIAMLAWAAVNVWYGPLSYRAGVPHLESRKSFPHRAVPTL